MLRDELIAVGERLYGARWQSALARALGVSDRTVRRWLAGDRRISAPTALAIRSLKPVIPVVSRRILRPSRPARRVAQRRPGMAPRPARSEPEAPGRW